MSEPFSVLLPTRQVPTGGKHVRIEPNDAQRRGIAQSLGIVDVDALTAELDVRPLGAEAFSVRGALTASVVQTDVITLDPVRQEVSETIDLTLVPAVDDSPARKRGAEQPDAADADERDVYRGGRIDLGTIVFEHLSLGLDPYPRSPDVEFSGHIEDDPATAPSAFAALASLKRDKD
jgi:uncharacterized protein DUF177 involved in 23S rRNA accumulation